MVDSFKEIFIFVAGATPQIITETVYALAHCEPPVYPDEIYIITTETGRRRIEDTIVRKDLFALMSKEFNIPLKGLTSESFIIVKDSQGNPLEDIRTEEENEAIGDTITSFIREKSKDMKARLHCSIAGGRKTMSFYLGAALQLFGRPWDKLYHVLVSPEFESNPEFFYKPKKNKVIECRMPDGTVKRLNTKDAEIQLAELPFIRLGNKISLHGKGFREFVAESQKEIDIATMQPTIRINLAERVIHIGDKLIEMIPMHLSLYTAFLMQKKEYCKHRERPYCFDCTDCYQSHIELSDRPALEEIVKYHRQIYKNQPLKSEELLNRWKDGMGIDVIRQGISKINRTIKEQLNDETILPYYSIVTVRKYSSSRYGVRVEKGKIRVE